MNRIAYKNFCSPFGLDFLRVLKRKYKYWYQFNKPQKSNLSHDVLITTNIRTCNFFEKTLFFILKNDISLDNTFRDNMNVKESKNCKQKGHTINRIISSSLEIDAKNFMISLNNAFFWKISWTHDKLCTYFV